MARKPNIIIFGLWSYCWKRVSQKFLHSTIISFSDNRLHSGNVYQKMGFVNDRDIPPDYYWYKNGKRHHKSTLRKTDKEKTTGLTETQLRQQQGYRKLYDLGKKRWIVNLA
jgi:hypothetical protein